MNFSSTFPDKKIKNSFVGSFMKDDAFLNSKKAQVSRGFLKMSLRGTKQSSEL